MKRVAASHAHALEDKAARRAAILQAANFLFVAGEGSLPTAAEIASATGLAKGTVYLYFRTKEEIFAALLLEGWIAVMQETEAHFQTKKGSRAAKVDAFLTALVAHLEGHPELLRLDALGYGVLEKNMLRDTLTAHKAEYMIHLEKTGGVIDAALRTAEGRGLELLMRTYALTRGLWQSYQHKEETLLAGVIVSHNSSRNPLAESFGRHLQSTGAEPFRWDRSGLDNNGGFEVSRIWRWD